MSRDGTSEWRWDAPPEPPRSELKTDPNALVRVAPSTLACPRCGAIVAQSLAERHQAWHLDVDPKRMERRSVHGMSSPRTDGIPWRYFTLSSSFSEAESLRQLRRWVAEQRADLGLDEPHGFRATLLGESWLQRTLGSDALMVRFAAGTVAGAPGTELEILLVAESSVMAGPAAKVAAAWRARFDGIEAGIRELLELR